MPSFADSFWSNGYANGLNVLFEKLSQGCSENEELLTLAAARAEAEEAYGNKLQELPKSCAPKKTGFGRDDGASMKRAYEGVVKEMGEEGKHHVQVAHNIRRMVIVPYGKWADEHSQRIEYSQGVLRSALRSYEKELAEVQNNQKKYFNKCRVYEDYKENYEGSGSDEPVEPVEPVNKETIEVQDAPIIIGDEVLTSDECRKMFSLMLDEIPQHDVKVPILGTYDHTSTGADIANWYMKTTETSVAAAEKFGQSLVLDGYLRLVGQVGSTFANSSVMHYQWRKKAYNAAERPLVQSRGVSEYFGETLSSYINANTDESPEERLKREVMDLDARYKISVLDLDDIRCKLEELFIDHFSFLERCEADRLKAMKAVLLDFTAAVSNVVPSIQSSVDKILLYQETVRPENDLRYILESYRTGLFAPKVTIYDNYYNAVQDQVFGLDLELRCRSDKKRVPYVVSAILSHMDAQYPVLENDEVRLGSWIEMVPLRTTHKLRRLLNTGKPFDRAILGEFEAPIVASVLKLYLVELPDSVVPNQYYDVIKTIYSQHGNDESPKARISAIQNIFAQLRVSNIATLDALTTHLTRLISITDASSEYRTSLAQELSNCLLRPRNQSSLTIEDRHPYRLALDLLTFHDQIFHELKRNNSAVSQQSPRRSSSIKSPEVKRRASLRNRMEALSLRIRQGPKVGSRGPQSQEPGLQVQEPGPQEPQKPDPQPQEPQEPQEPQKPQKPQEPQKPQKPQESQKPQKPQESQKPQKPDPQPQEQPQITVSKDSAEERDVTSPSSASSGSVHTARSVFSPQEPEGTLSNPVVID